MTRSHPPSLLTAVARALTGELAPLVGRRILVATSGGGDSQALLHVLATLAPRYRLEVIAHGVDHGLRPAARGELALVRHLAERLNVPFGASALAVASGPNLQARARDARRRELMRVAGERAADFVATAHHADDRAETVLLRLLRGAGVTGLGALPAIDGTWARPLARVPREALVRHLARHAIPWAEDPSNREQRYLRARVRADLLPRLREVDPAIVAHLGHLADEALRIRDGAPRFPLTRAQTEQLAMALVAGAGRDIALGGGASLRVIARRRQSPAKQPAVAGRIA